MKCCVCNKEMTYLEDSSFNPNYMICVNSSRSNGKRYGCDCGVGYNETLDKWHIHQIHKRTSKQEYLAQRILNNIGTILNIGMGINTNKEHIELYFAIKKEYDKSITKNQTSEFIQKYKQLETVDQIMSLPHKVEVKVYNGVLIGNIN